MTTLPERLRRIADELEAAAIATCPAEAVGYLRQTARSAAGKLYVEAKIQEQQREAVEA